MLVFYVTYGIYEHTSPRIVCKMKSSKLYWVRHVARMGGKIYSEFVGEKSGKIYTWKIKKNTNNFELDSRSCEDFRERQFSLIIRVLSMSVWYNSVFD
jgi:hypothetical protein